MYQSYCPPCTVRGIRRLARTISGETGVKYNQALDRAAVDAGFQNFKHAKNSLPAEDLETLYLTVYWRTLGTPRSAGRCTAAVRLPPQEVALVEQMKIRGYLLLGGFDLESSDHLRARHDAATEETARKRITDALRELQFSSATGLRKALRKYEKHRIPSFQNLPGRDHASFWIDPQSDHWLVLDEPYPPRYESRHSARRAWLAQNAFREVTPHWAGLYLPGQSMAHLVGSDESFLTKVGKTVEAIGELPAVDWESQSSTYFSDFYSPKRIASGIRYRPRAQRSYGERNGAVPYGGRPGTPSDWRPAASMTLEQHTALGILLKRLNRCDLPARADDKLSQIISMLDDWSAIEHRDHQGSDLSLLYYGESQPPYLDERSLRKGVDEALAVIRAGYNTCKPRRDLLAAIEAIGEAGIGRLPMSPI